MPVPKFSVGEMLLFLQHSAKLKFVLPPPIFHPHEAATDDMSLNGTDRRVKSLYLMETSLAGGGGRQGECL